MPICRYLLIVVLAWSPIGAAIACADPPRTAFREMVLAAPTIFTFQLTSAYYIHKPLGGGAYTEHVVGLIRVVDSLKGDASAFKIIKYSFRRCGATRMSVGQLYLAATSQTGPVLELWGTDQAILDLTLDVYHESTKRSPVIDVVKSIIGGAPVPNDFPRDELVMPLDVYPALPPPAPSK